MALSLASLHESTGLLPDIDINMVHGLAGGAESCGTGTAEAMAQGVLQMTVGAVMRAIDCCQSVHGALHTDIDLKFAGGSAAILARRFQQQTEPYLVFQGARAMILGGVTGHADTGPIRG
jgi:pantothenate kinase type III